MPKWTRAVWAACLVTALSACSTTRPPLVLAQPVDTERLAGDWYVIASIPTTWEAGAYDAKDSFTVKPDGKLDTTFTFHADSSDGPLRSYRWIGTSLGPGNVVWRQHFLWPVDRIVPIDRDFRIAYMSPDYRQAVIANDDRDNVWILARAPKITDAEYQGLLTFTARIGYDASQVRRVPQSGAQ